MILSIAPMPFEVPNWLSNLKPDWIVLGWFFWIVFQSERCSLVLAFIIGLFLDVLLDEPFGLNSLLLIFLVFIGRLSLGFLSPNIGVRSSLVLLILCFLVTTTKSIVLFVTLDVAIQLGSLITPSLVTLIWWLLLVPLLSTEHSQFNDDVH